MTHYTNMQLRMLLYYWNYLHGEYITIDKLILDYNENYKNILRLSKSILINIKKLVTCKKKNKTTI